MAEASTDHVLLHSLPALQRLALAYAPARSRQATMALFALDTRLASLLRQSSEPMLAQLRLAWWRETLAQPASSWPAGEPLLAALASWQDRHGPLVALVDGWEALCGPAPLPEAALDEMADGRGKAFAALADAIGHGEHAGTVASIGRDWALCDLAGRLGNETERAGALTLASSGFTTANGLPRELRPLLVLQRLARRGLTREGADKSPAALALAMRIGLFGR